MNDKNLPQEVYSGMAIAFIILSSTKEYIKNGDKIDFDLVNDKVSELSQNFEQYVSALDFFIAFGNILDERKRENNGQ